MASHLFLSETHSDVILKVRHEGYSWRVPAHSLLLVTKSSALRELLEERTEDEQPYPLTMSGVNPETAVAVLNYIYKDEYPKEPTADLLIATQKYNLSSLRDNLEESIMSDMTVPQACRLLEELLQRQPTEVDCPIKCAAQDMVEKHALTVFGSDLVLSFSKRTMTDLLMSNHLNVPDEAYVFWGVWRWAKRQSSKHNRCMTDDNVASYIDDLVVNIRHCGIRNRKGIPSVATCRFDRCRGRRNMYCCPPDILNHTNTLRLTPSWDDIFPAKITDTTDMLCAQLSFERDVLLVGMTFEACPNDQNQKLKLESYVRIIRESDCEELRRQRLCWCKTRLRRTSIKDELEYRLETELCLIEPVFLTPGNIYSIYIRGNFNMVSFVWASIRKRRQRVNNTFVNLHGDGVTAMREIYLIPDMSVTWGPRGPDV